MSEEAQRADVVLTVGGVSVGPRDHVRTALGDLVEVFRVALRPAKPFATGRAGDALVCCLPGNPLSAMAAFEVFVRPALNVLLGRPPGERRRLTARLTAPFEQAPGVCTCSAPWSGRWGTGGGSTWSVRPVPDGSPRSPDPTHGWSCRRTRARWLPATPSRCGRRTISSGRRDRRGDGARPRAAARGRAPSDDRAAARRRRQPPDGPGQGRHRVRGRDAGLARGAHARRGLRGGAGGLRRRHAPQRPRTATGRRREARTRAPGWHRGRPGGGRSLPGRGRGRRHAVRQPGPAANAGGAGRGAGCRRAGHPSGAPAAPRRLRDRCGHGLSRRARSGTPLRS